MLHLFLADQIDLLLCLFQERKITSSACVAIMKRIQAGEILIIFFALGFVEFNIHIIFWSLRVKPVCFPKVDSFFRTEGAKLSIPQAIAQTHIVSF